MTKMEVSWKYDIQNRYAKIIPPKILNRISLMLINYNITTSNTRKEGSFDSVIGQVLRIRLIFLSGWNEPPVKPSIAHLVVPLEHNVGIIGVRGIPHVTVQILVGSPAFVTFTRSQIIRTHFNHHCLSKQPQKIMKSAFWMGGDMLSTILTSNRFPFELGCSPFFKY
jgi:hypothetical protein